MGRSGTTALMKLLASTPAVVTECEYPYESRYITYFCSLSRMLDGDLEAAGKWQRANMLAQPPEQIGGLPWRRLVPDVNGLADDCFLDIWSRFSAGIAGGGTHYIEKVSRWVSNYVPSILPGTRIIHLIRDPRDVWLSVAAFNAKRGFRAFGRKGSDDDESFLQRFIGRARQRLEPLLERDLGSNEMLIRYEDFISDVEATSVRLADWLDLELDPAVLAERVDEHATASSKEESLMRWKRELPSELRKRFKCEMSDLLKGFGYG